MYIYLFVILPIFYSIIIYLLFIFLIIYWLATVGDLASATSVGDLAASKKTRGHIYAAEYVYIHTCTTLSRHYHAHFNF